MGLRKAAEAETLNKFGRNPESPAEKERGRAPSAWSAGGVPVDRYTAFPHFFWADIARLTSGKVQVLLLMYVWRQTVGLERKKGVKASELTPWLPWHDLASVFHCSANAVKEEIADLKTRKVITAEEKHGEVRITLLWKTWESLVDYEPGRPEAVPDKPKPDPDTPLWKRPRSVKPGERSTARVNFAQVDAVTLVNSNGSELCFNLVGCKTEIQVHIVHQEKKGDQKAKATGKSELQASSASGLAVSGIPAPVKPAGVKACFSSPLAASLAAIGIISDISRKILLADCEAASEGMASEAEIFEAVEGYAALAKADPKSRNVGGIVLRAVPKYFASEAYKAGMKPWLTKKPAMSERERLADEIWGSGRKKNA